MGVILDSSEIIALERSRGLVESLVAGREDEPFGISVVTVAELLHGVERADTETRRIRRQAFVEKIIEMIPVIPFDIGVARIYARIWASLMQRGFTVGAHDLIIASTAISLDYTVITANRRDFEKIEGLRLEVREG
ncbi:ribonuclease VapC5 [Geobacter sp. OR-1]|uniref:type II toxin-antitoxin system VapC family toxin n=1 Tax=Geobacter sp. OR-1 TaxID=1266765 RepID=UPI000542B2DB|nr:type II toxin-antitoxin system VapC family toxin [Geobacter sp. OR-1]GAM09022.1 ribonuclease VapC5 [Geobacter sp. OR-1]